jgi:hypothetical protein
MGSADRVTQHWGRGNLPSSCVEDLNIPVVVHTVVDERDEEWNKWTRIAVRFNKAAIISCLPLFRRFRARATFPPAVLFLSLSECHMAHERAIDIKLIASTLRLREAKGLEMV